MMTTLDRKKHWEKIYNTKSLQEVSWYQQVPETSLMLIDDLNLSKDASIIDVGGGDSFLVDFLLEKGFENISVLDISEAAIEKAKLRLGQKAKKVNWIVADVAEFMPTQHYDLWHDRAAFHFLTEEKDIERYVELAKKYITHCGYLIVGTFSEKGPKKCSGIEIRQYSEQGMEKRFYNGFDKLKCTSVNHQTPFDTLQNFTFCCFKKI